MERELLLATPALLAFIAVHLFAGRLRFLDRVPRSRVLSVSGGVSLAYVFLHLLPELDEGGHVLERAVGPTLSFIDHHVFVVALLGTVCFYGLERAARRSRSASVEVGYEDKTSAGVFWLHMASFSLYNVLIAYVLVRREQRGVTELALFTLAMTLHFFVTDHGLRHHHKEDYRRIGRFVLSGALVLGAVLGASLAVGEPVRVIVLAFLAGGVILNVLKEELPAEHESRFAPFLSGTAIYGALLLAL